MTDLEDLDISYALLLTVYGIHFSKRQDEYRKGVKPLTIQQIATIEIPVTDIPGLSLGMNRF